MPKFIDRSRLKGEIFEKKIKVVELCKILNISRQAFYAKLNGKTDFSEKEIITLLSIFGNVITYELPCAATPN